MSSSFDDQVSESCPGSTIGPALAADGRGMSMPDWPENNKPSAINPAAHLSFNIPQNSGNNPGVNYGPLNNLTQQQFPQQPQHQQFQPPFSPTVNGLKRQREPSDGLSPKSVPSPRPRTVTPSQQQHPQTSNHVIFPNQQNLQQPQQNFSSPQLRPQPQVGPQQMQQFANNFANLPPHIQQRLVAQHPQNAAQLQQMQLAQQQQQQQQAHQARQPGTQHSPTYNIQPAPNRFVQPQTGQPAPQVAQFDPGRPQFNPIQHQPANQMQPPMNQNQQIYQQRLLQQQQQHQHQQQQLAQAGSPPNAQAGLPQFQSQPLHQSINQLSTQPSPAEQRSPALRNLQAPKSTNSPLQPPRPLPPSNPQQPLQMQPQQQQQPQQSHTPQQIVPQPQNQNRPQWNKEAFMKSLSDLMIRRGTPIQSIPFIASRQIDLFTLYVTVMKEGGFQAVTNKGAWGRVAAQNNIPVGNDPNLPTQLAELYKGYLAPFEEAFQKHQAMRRQMTANVNQQRPGVQQTSQQHPIQPQMSATPHTPQQPPLISNQTPHQTPIQASQQTPQGMHHLQATSNGMQQMQQMPPQHQTPNILPNHMQRMPQPQGPLPGQTPQRPIFQQPPPPQHPGKTSVPPQSPIRKASLEPTPQPPSRRASIGKPVAPAKKPQYQPKKRNIDTHGGWHLQELIRYGHAVEQLRPSVPQMQDLGAVDIHALTMSLRSGLPGEMCNALDVLTVMLNDARTVLSLNDCWDLLDSLIEIGEDDCEILEEGLRAKKRRVSCSPSREKKMFLEFERYHDLVQSCQGFAEDLDELVYGSERDSQQLKMSADRLLCVTALLRNFSFVEFNHQLMANEDVVRFISRVLRGVEASKTRPFMVSYRNNLELVRDLVTILSNIAHCVRLPDIDCAQPILSFLVSFSSENHRILDPEVLIFSSAKPGRDTYLAPALDALAKLLVVEHPNKEFFTTLLRASTDKPANSKFSRGDIFLTRAFAMAVSVLPTNEPAQAFFTKEERMALAEQGMMAATALVEMLPHDGDLARYWLSAKDNFGARLVRTVFHLAAIPDQRLPVGIPSGGGMYSHITRRGMRIVEVMSSRATKGLKDGEIVAVACSKKEQLLGAMLTTSMDGAIVESLWKLHDIEDNAAGAGPPRAESPKRSR